jgi:hypothetical protein
MLDYVKTMVGRSKSSSTLNLSQLNRKSSTLPEEKKKSPRASAPGRDWEDSGNKFEDIDNRLRATKKGKDVAAWSDGMDAEARSFSPPGSPS